MAQYLTHKSGDAGKALTMQRRTVRTLKYSGSDSLTRSARAKAVR